MKEKVLIISNSVLAFAVIVLFVLHFKKPVQDHHISNTPSAAVAAIPSGSIVYVNVDTLQKKFDMYSDHKGQFLDKQKRMEAEFVTKSKAYETKVRDYQEKAQKGLLLRSEAEKAEQQLMQEQQTILHMRETMSAQLMEEEQVMNRKITFAITDFLKEYNSDGRYQYIFSYMFGGNILYVPASLDITNDVLKGLNDQYAAQKQKK